MAGIGEDTLLAGKFNVRVVLAAAIVSIWASFAAAADRSGPTDLRVGASAVNLKCDSSMVLAGMIEPRYTDEQEGELRAVAVVIEKPAAGHEPGNKLAIVACDVLWIPRPQVDAALAEIEKTTGIRPQNVLINATHTHHAPSTAPAHGFGVSQKFCEELKRGIVHAVQEANKNLSGGQAAFFFALGEEKTVGANSRLKLPNHNITWLNPAREAGPKGIPPGRSIRSSPSLIFATRPARRGPCSSIIRPTRSAREAAKTSVRPVFTGWPPRSWRRKSAAPSDFWKGPRGRHTTSRRSPSPRRSSA